jgi:hypothetical protein
MDYFTKGIACKNIEGSNYYLRKILLDDIRYSDARYRMACNLLYSNFDSDNDELLFCAIESGKDDILNLVMLKFGKLGKCSLELHNMLEWCLEICDDIVLNKVLKLNPPYTTYAFYYLINNKCIDRLKTLIDHNNQDAYAQLLILYNFESDILNLGQYFDKLTNNITFKIKEDLYRKFLSGGLEDYIFETRSKYSIDLRLFERSKRLYKNNYITWALEIAKCIPFKDPNYEKALKLCTKCCLKLTPRHFTTGKKYLYSEGLSKARLYLGDNETMRLSLKMKMEDFVLDILKDTKINYFDESCFSYWNYGPFLNHDTRHSIQMLLNLGLSKHTISNILLKE